MAGSNLERYEKTLRVIAEGRLNILEVYELIEWVVDLQRDPETCFDYSEEEKSRIRAAVRRWPRRAEHDELLQLLRDDAAAGARLRDFIEEHPEIARRVGLT